MPANPNVKILQAQGLGSRKICEKIFNEAIDSINGGPFDPKTSTLHFGDVLEINGESLQLRQKVHLLLNKPAGYEISHKPSAHPSVFDLLPPHFINRGVQAAGRLDVDTTGVLLFSDDGQFIHQVISGKKKEQFVVEKEYWITTARPITPEQIKALCDGVQLHDEPEPIRAQSVEATGSNSMKMIITTGKYHQVKRMVAAAGNHVEKLHRQRVGDYVLPSDLPEGEFVYLDVITP